jgi:N-methylhydantoinase B
VYRPLDHTAYFSGQAERFTSRPWGLFGGGSAASGSFRITGDADQTRALPAKAATVPIEAGSVLVVTTPGGGGYGPPDARRADCLDEDRRSGKFTQASAGPDGEISAPHRRQVL